MDFTQLYNVTLDPKANTLFEALGKAISPIPILFGGRETWHLDGPNWTLGDGE